MVHIAAIGLNFHHYSTHREIMKEQQETAAPEAGTAKPATRTSKAVVISLIAGMALLAGSLYVVPMATDSRAKECRQLAKRMANYDAKLRPFAFTATDAAPYEFGKRIALSEVQYQNGFGVWRTVTIKCTYDMLEGRIRTESLDAQQF